MCIAQRQCSHPACNLSATCFTCRITLAVNWKVSMRSQSSVPCRASKKMFSRYTSPWGDKEEPLSH
eukprot:2400738-Amphidinium_carterae.1